jgi:hypothetical protein
MKTNIHIGVDHNRIQQNKPSFFVYWEDENGHNYEFFALRFAAERLKNRLKEEQTITT